MKMKIPEKGMWEHRREIEKREGKPLTIYSAYPLIGRGSVQHETVSHTEAELVIERAIRVPFRTRLNWELNRLFNRV